MKKIFALLLIPLFLAPVNKLSAQTYQGTLPSGFDSEAQFPTSQAPYPIGEGSLNYVRPANPGSLTQQFTVDPVALTFQFDSVTFQNVTLPALTGTYVLGVGTVANITITFNPLNFVLVAPLEGAGNENPVPLSPVSGASQPTYQLYYSLYNPPLSGLNLTGSYSITSPVGSASGTFSDPINFIGFQLTPEIQFSGYPNSLAFTGTGGFFDLELTPVPTTLFTATVDGVTISPEYDRADQIFNFGTPTTFTEVVPEPSTWALLLSGLGLLACWRSRPCLAVN